jgi:hypothetical protein
VGKWAAVEICTSLPFSIDLQTSQDLSARLQQRISGSEENYPNVAAGRWYTYPSEKYEFVSWDDKIPN